MSGRSSFEMAGWFYDLRDDLADRLLSVPTAAIAYAINSNGDLRRNPTTVPPATRDHGGRSVDAWIQLGMAEFDEGHFEQAVGSPQARLRDR